MKGKKHRSDFEYLSGLLSSQAMKLSKSDATYVLTSLNAKSVSVRSLAAQVAGQYFESCFECKLVKLLKDWSLIVRVNACDSLSNSKNTSICKHIVPLMSCIRHPLERGYALLSYSDIVINSGSSKLSALHLLKSKLRRERNPWARVFGIEAVAQLGDASVLPELIKLFHAKQNNTRRVAIKCAKKYLSDLSQDQLISALIKQGKREKDASITQEIDTFLKYFSNC